MTETVLLYDAYSLIYRAFFAIRVLTGPDGAPVNAIYGLTKMLKKMAADHTPSHHAAVFDLGAPQKRLALLPSYKAQRPPTPPTLETQLPAIREILQALCIPIVEIEGDEADDIIATLAVQASSTGRNVLIASSDKDFMQIVGPRIGLLRGDGKETVIVDPAGVKTRYGVAPGQMVDFLSLLGDSVDNIPGAPGVGEKTAAQLLQTYGTLENLLAHVSEIVKPKLRETLMTAAERLQANRQLIALQTNVPLTVDLDALKIRPPDTTSLAVLYRRFGFKSLLAELTAGTKPSPTKERDLFGPQ
jgi:DNA polymerase I